MGLEENIKSDSMRQSSAASCCHCSFSPALPTHHCSLGSSLGWGWRRKNRAVLQVIGHMPDCFLGRVQDWKGNVKKKFPWPFLQPGIFHSAWADMPLRAGIWQSISGVEPLSSVLGGSVSPDLVLVPVLGRRQECWEGTAALER